MTLKAALDKTISPEGPQSSCSRVFGSVSFPLQMQMSTCYEIVDFLRPDFAFMLKICEKLCQLTLDNDTR